MSPSSVFSKPPRLCSLLSLSLPSARPPCSLRDKPFATSSLRATPSNSYRVLHGAHHHIVYCQIIQYNVVPAIYTYDN